MFDQYEIVRLTADLPEENLKKGTIGTVLIVLDLMTPVQHYIVEFVDSEGTSLGTPFVPEDLLDGQVH